jgi:N-acetylneuraminic acid mutarotase
MRYLKVYFLALTVFTLASCTSNDDTTKLGNWLTRADYSGDARRDAVSFVIGDTAYVGTGYGGPVPVKKLSSFYKYDPAKDAWTSIASLVDPANPTTNDLSRQGASAFTVGTRGYVTSGFDNNFEMRKDTWEYNPATNSWAPKADFPGAPRYYAVGFGLGEFGYIGTGSSGSGGSNYSDFFKFAPGAEGTPGTWSEINPLKDKRQQAVAFVIKDTAYVVTGTSNSEATTRFYAYDSKNDQWLERFQIKNATDGSFDDDYTTLARYGAVAFVINNKAYLTTGTLSNTWEFDPMTSLWTEKTQFDAASRTGAVGFSVKNRGFVGLGLASSVTLDDLHEFDPAAENDTND